MSNRDKVIYWIQTGMDYNKGVELLVEISGKKQFISQFNGSSRSLVPKLAYEICKASGLADVRTWKQFIDLVKHQSNPDQVLLPDPNHSDPAPKRGIALHLWEAMSSQEEGYTSDATQESLSESPAKQYPPVMRRVIHEYAAAFQERSKLHSVMAEMPESNTDSVCAARAELFDVIKSLSARLEQFYEAKTLFETEGTLPDPEQLFPSQPTQLQEDYNSLDQEELKKRKKYLQNGNSKDQSLLDYQAKEHGLVLRPMPQGPKRLKIEYRMRQRVQQILQIDQAQLKYVIKE